TIASSTFVAGCLQGVMAPAADAVDPPCGYGVIAAGEAFSFAVAGGVAYSWGANSDGELGDGTTTERRTPVQVLGLTGVSAISGAERHSLALRSDGTVWAWGYNTSG